MKISKQFNYTGSKLSKPEDYLKSIDSDLTNLFLLAKGRVRFGATTDNARGENISGEFQTFTTADADSQGSITHTLGSVPIGIIVLGQNKAGSLYSGTTANSSTTVYYRCDVSAVTFTTFLIK
jgi:hypothetical protein